MNMWELFPNRSQFHMVTFWTNSEGDSRESLSGEKKCSQSGYLLKMFMFKHLSTKSPVLWSAFWFLLTLLFRDQTLGLIHWHFHQQHFLQNRDIVLFLTELKA
jgi:hypothetical protein